jgi:hypothetical protein
VSECTHGCAIPGGSRKYKSKRQHSSCGKWDVKEGGKIEFGRAWSFKNNTLKLQNMLRGNRISGIKTAQEFLAVSSQETSSVRV